MSFVAMLVRKDGILATGHGFECVKENRMKEKASGQCGCIFIAIAMMGKKTRIRDYRMTAIQTWYYAVIF